MSTQHKILFNVVYEEFKEYSYYRHKKQGYETLIRNFENHILPIFKDKYVNDLTKKDIIEWQNIIYSKKFSDSFNNSLYSAFSSFIKFCIYNSYLNENIVLDVGNFKKNNIKKQHKTYTLYQFRLFRRYVNNIVYKQFFNFMYFYGTRPSEALALKFSDLEGNIIHIRHNLQRRGNRELDTPKNKSSIRDFNINFITRIQLFILKCYYDKIYNDSNYDYFIFGGKKPLSTSTIDRVKKIACDKANLYNITMHEFRHSCCTRRIHNKESIDKVSHDLGHSKPSTTLDIYTHLEQEKRVTGTLFSNTRVFNWFGSSFKTLLHYIITRFFV